jgi:hypothetical protein
MAEYVIMGNGTDYCEIMCSDIIHMENIVFINETSNLKSKSSRLFDLLLQEAIRKTRLSFFQSIQFKSYFSGVFVPERDDLRFIFFDSNAHAGDELFLKYIKKKYKAKLILYVINPASSISLDRRFCSKAYDLVVTVFGHDANSYGWHTCNHVYTKIARNEPNNENGYSVDVFFAGRAKNRLEDIFHTYEFLINHGIKCDFHIFEVDEKEMRYTGDIKYNNWLPYEEMLKRMLQSKCILEILQKNGKGPTLRMIEAVVYNKKILTNDKDAVNNPFYDKRFIQIFDNPENLDLGFVKDDTEPNYHYNGEYSAKNLLKCIEKNLVCHNPHQERT